MKRVAKRLSALFLAISLMLSGCKFVVKEESVLTNPREESVVADATTDSDDGDKVTQEEVTQEETTQKDNDAEDSDKVSNNNSKKPTTSVAKNKEPALSGTLEIQLRTNGKETIDDAWTQVITKFEEETGVKVTACMGTDANTRMSKRWLGGNPPDVVLLSGSGIPDLAWETSGTLYDMADLLKKGYVYGTNEKIWDVTNHNMMWRSNTSEKYYRAGIMAGSYGTFYDAAYLKKLGVSAPTNYTELMDFVETMKKKDIPVYTSNGGAGGYPLWSLIMPALAAYGQDFLDDLCLGKASAWRSSKVKSVLQRYNDFCRTDGAVMSGTVTFDHTLAQMNWLKHETALVGSGIWLPWECGSLVPSGFEMQYMSSPLTLEKQKPAIVLNSVCMMIASKAKNMENAQAFVRFLYRKDVQQLLCSSQGYMGARTDMNYAKLPGLDSTSKRFLTYMTSGKVNLTYQKYTWGDLDTEICGAAIALMGGTMTVEQAIEYIASKGKK